MTDNVINVNGAEVYQHRIYELADEFIQRELDGDKEKVRGYFASMIFYCLYNGVKTLAFRRNL